jgi:mono/diheme cytochrome c family protein
VTNSTVGDQMPDLSEIMTEEQVWDLVKFLKEEAIDTDLIYSYTTTGIYPTGSITYSDIGAGGNAANGDAVYAASCAICHGADGTGIVVDGSYSVGSFLRAKPYEVQAASCAPSRTRSTTKSSSGSRGRSWEAW